MNINSAPIPSDKILNILRRNRQIPFLLRELIIDEEIKSTSLPDSVASSLIRDFRSDNSLDSDSNYEEYLTSNYLSEEILYQSLERIRKVVLFREDKWGPQVNSLYLQNKEKYDSIKFYLLQSASADLMQETYFRLKDGEASWDDVFGQLHPDKKSLAVNPLVGPVPVANIEPFLRDALTKSNPGVILPPLQHRNTTYVVQLIEISHSRLDDDLRTKILQDQFEQWLENKLKIISKTIHF